MQYSIMLQVQRRQTLTYAVPLFPLKALLEATQNICTLPTTLLLQPLLGLLSRPTHLGTIGHSSTSSSGPSRQP